MIRSINPSSSNFTKWSNTLKQFVNQLGKNSLSVFDHFLGLALKGLSRSINNSINIIKLTLTKFYIMFFHEIFIDINNMTSIKRSITNRKIVHTLI